MSGIMSSSFVMLYPIICAIALAIINCGEAAAETELAQFFPSQPIHEDDHLSGYIEANIQGCYVTLTETSGRYSIVSQFDVQRYETDPGRLFWPYGKQLSTRYNVGWPAKFSDTSIEELNTQFFEARVSMKDRRTLSLDEILTKSKPLETWLSEIRSGRHGQYAQKNHRARFLTGDPDLLISVSINTYMGFPVQATDMSSLAHAMYRHSIACN